MMQQEMMLERPRAWTVTEFTQRIRSVLEPSFSQVWVQGEISNYRPAPSGHLYFSLKDQGACLSAAIFAWGGKSVKLPKLKDGMQVLCRGKISLYPPRGSYQLIVDQLEPLGVGALQIAFEKLKAKLSAEGLFDARLKRPLPAFPSRIAVITSPTGAVIQDILHVLKRRAPQVQVLVIPALMQGEEAPQQIIQALEVVNRHRLGEVIILARGGGSIEDLWGFNHEELARAIRRSELPVISAVGHETDFTISDFVSDLRAPTPSAAAEILSGRWVEALSQFRDFSQRLHRSILRDLSTRKALLSHITARVISPKDRLREQAQRIDEIQIRMEKAFGFQLDRKRSSVSQLSAQLDALSPLRVLKRGYTLVKDSTHDVVIKSAQEVHSAQELKITFYDGQRVVRAI